MAGIRSSKLLRPWMQEEAHIQDEWMNEGLSEWKWVSKLSFHGFVELVFSPDSVLCSRIGIFSVHFVVSFASVAGTCRRPSLDACDVGWECCKAIASQTGDVLLQLNVLLPAKWWSLPLDPRFQAADDALVAPASGRERGNQRALDLLLWQTLVGLPVSDHLLCLSPSHQSSEDTQSRLDPLLSAHLRVWHLKMCVVLRWKVVEAGGN